MSSRYDQGRYVWVQHPEHGLVQVVHLTPLLWTNYPYTQYLAKESDRLDTLAAQTYGDPRDYWFIGEMNPQIACPDDIKAGETIFIPTGKPG